MSYTVIHLYLFIYLYLCIGFPPLPGLRGMFSKEVHEGHSVVSPWLHFPGIQPNSNLVVAGNVLLNVINIHNQLTLSQGDCPR